MQTVGLGERWLTVHMPKVASVRELFSIVVPDTIWCRLYGGVCGGRGVIV